MDIKKQIQSILQEIEAYRSHSLFPEAKKRCQELAELIRQSKRLKNKEKHLATVSKKIKELENAARDFNGVTASVQMSAKEQAIVKKLFAYSTGEGADSAVMNGAIALCVFGQFKGALGEFNKLLTNDSFRVVAAKNIIRCHVGLDSLDDAVTQYQQWLSIQQFPDKQLEQIRPFLQGILKRKGVAKSLPKPQLIADVKEPETIATELLDIISIVIYLDVGAQKDIELDVSFQKKNIISVIIPSIDKTLTDYLQVGLKLNNVQFNSYDTIFFDSCVITEKNIISLGPKKGNYFLTLKILDTQ